MKLPTHRFHFFKTLTCALVLLGIASASLFYALFVPTLSDSHDYQELLFKSNAANTKEPASPYKAKQLRTRVQRDFFFGVAEDRLHGCLKSKASEIHVDHQDGLTEIIETMDEIVCLLQEKLFFEEGIPFQQILRIEADKGQYRYQTGQLKAEGIKIYRYRMPGHSLSSHFAEQPEVEGRGDLLELSIKDKNPQLLLKGAVSVVHDFGRVSSDEMILKPVKENGNLVLSSLEVNGQVKFYGRTGEELSCSRAFFDFQTSEGEFFAGNETEPVTYVENHEEAESSLALKSKKMKVVLNKEKQIATIAAEDQVYLDYGHQFMGLADLAVFKRSLSANQTKQALPGVISLRSHMNQGDLCQITNQNGDLMTAVEIDLDTIKQEISCYLTKGVFSADYLEKEGGRITFSADRMKYRKNNNQLTLQDHVIIAQEGVGTFTTDNEVSFFHEKVQGKNQLKTIEGKGSVLLTKQGQKQNDNYTITSHGGFVIDHTTLTVRMESPLNEAGEVKEGMQTFYHDAMREIYANHVTLDYQSLPTLQLEKVILEGNVRFLDQAAVQNGITSPLAKYGMADKMEYTPLLDSALLTANSGSRVLFYSKANDLKISAPALRISRSKETKKEAIKGLGDVRFSFIEREFEQLKNRFSAMGTAK